MNDLESRIETEFTVINSSLETVDSDIKDLYGRTPVYIRSGSNAYTSGVNGDFTIYHNFGFSGSGAYALIPRVIGSSVNYIVCSNSSGNTCYCQLINGQTGKPVGNTEINVVYIGIGGK